MEMRANLSRDVFLLVQTFGVLYLLLVNSDDKIFRTPSKYSNISKFFKENLLTVLSVFR